VSSKRQVCAEVKIEVELCFIVESECCIAAEMLLAPVAAASSVCCASVIYLIQEKAVYSVD